MGGWIARVMKAWNGMVIDTLCYEIEVRMYLSHTVMDPEK